MERLQPLLREAARDSRRFRNDINGLRALAVVPVVAFHAGISGLPGGFTGVDVFFVISGFLITGLLLREAEMTGRIALGHFWAKRLRRLVPALALVVAVTLTVSALTSSPLLWTTLARDATAAVTYVSNLLFAYDSTNYFADDLTQSPFLHTWSLSLEEQFYLVWPLLVVLALRLGNRIKLNLRLCLLVLFGALLVASLALSVLMTDVRQNLAFYLLPTRAWEFAAGGLLAVLPTASYKVRDRTCTILRFCGVILLAVSFLTVQSDGAFPGYTAAVPVLGTLMIIAAGNSSRGYADPVIAALESRILQWIGTRSYSWYLWHWPAITIACVIFQSDATWLKISAAVIALGLAVLTHKFVENKFRTADTLTKSNKVSFLAAGTTGMAISLIAGLLVVAAAWVNSKPPYMDYVAARGVVSSQECDRSSWSANGLPLCEMGDLNSERTIMLVGDSHAGHWKSALSAAASQSGIRLLVRWKSACPATGLNVITTNGDWVQDCPQFHNDTLNIVRQEKPAAVVLAQSNDYAGRILSREGSQLSGSKQLDLWGSELARTINQLAETGTQVGYIVDNPGTEFDSVLCQTRMLPFTKDCSNTREEVMSEPLREVDSSVLTTLNVQATFSPVDQICSKSRCEVTTPDGVPIYRDRTHLSEQWTKTQVPFLRDFLSSLLAGTPSQGCL